MSGGGTEAGGAANKLINVAHTQSQPEAEMLQGLLEDRGIPSILRALGVDGPQLGFGVLSTAPQQILVRADQAEEARALLAEALAAGQRDDWPEIAGAGYSKSTGDRTPHGYGLLGAYARIYLWSFGALAVAFGVFLLLHGG